MSKGSTTPESLLKLLPGLQTTEAIKHIIRKNLGGWNNAIRTYAPKTDFWAIAKDLLEKRKALVTSGKASDYTVVEFAHALGSATTHSTSALKYIRRKLNTSITWEEIKKLILDC